MSDLSVQLLEAMKREFQFLRQDQDFQLGDDFLDEVQLGATARNTFFSCKKHGAQPRLNPNHKVITALMNSRERSKTHLYYLLSAVYSIVNRAVEEIEDSHEREFHAKILETLLAGRPGRWTDLA